MKNLTTIPKSIARLSSDFPGMFTSTGLTLNPNLSFNEWECIVESLFAIEKGVQWWIGDALNFGEGTYGEMYTQVFHATGLGISSVMSYQYTSAKYPRNKRLEGLSFAHHNKAVVLEEPLRSEYLRRAEEEGWSVAELSGRIANIQISNNLPAKSHDVSPSFVESELTFALKSLGSLPEETQQEIVTQVLEKIGGDNESSKLLEKAVSGIKAQVTVWTGNNERYTPLEYIEKARQALGSIDTDPASNDHAQENIRASTFYTEETNGLCQEWHGRVWLNPPYSNPEIGQFIDKLIEEYQAGRTTAAILLTNNSADTNWFDRASRQASAICFTKGRINFYDENDETTQPTNGQTFFYFGKDSDTFKEIFSSVGGIYQRIA